MNLRSPKLIVHNQDFVTRQVRSQCLNNFCKDKNSKLCKKFRPQNHSFVPKTAIIKWFLPVRVSKFLEPPSRIVGVTIVFWALTLHLVACIAFKFAAIQFDHTSIICCCCQWSIAFRNTSRIKSIARIKWHCLKNKGGSAVILHLYLYVWLAVHYHVSQKSAIIIISQTTTEVDLA